MSSQIRVLVVDNHALIREGIASLLASQSDIQIAGQANSGQQAIELARALKPDLILMDLVMPGMSGTTAARHILEFLPDCKVIMLTDDDDEEHLFEAVHYGAMGYVKKDTTDGLNIDLRQVDWR